METFDYILRLNDIHSRLVARPDHPEPSWVRITTITMCSTFNEKIDIAKFREGMTAKAPIRIRNAGTSFKGFEWNIAEKKNKKGDFYNCVSVWYSDCYSTKKIKLFPNGSIQVCGGANLFDCWMILEHLSWLVSHVLDLEKPVVAAKPSIAMINTNFSLNSQVNIKREIDRFKRDRRFEVTFNPERYPAVKLKFSPEPGMKQVTASLFSTGKVIVTGAQTLDEIASAYQVINGMFDDKSLYAEGRPAKPEKFDIFMGARFEEWVRVISEKNRV